MTEYVGFDVSKEETAFCIMDRDGTILARGKVAKSRLFLRLANTLRRLANTNEPINRLFRHAWACHGHPWIAGSSPAMTTEE